MDQETRWLTKYNEVVEFIQTNHRNPSRHRIEGKPPIQRKVG